MALSNRKDLLQMIELRRVSPWFMWAVGFLGVSLYAYEPFSSNVWIWFVVNMILFSVGFVLWRIYYNSGVVVK